MCNSGNSKYRSFYKDIEGKAAGQKNKADNKNNNNRDKLDLEE